MVDPPWYFDFIRPMLATAALVCRPGGFVLVSLPSEGTRPSAPEDRLRTLRYLERLSFEIVSVTPGGVGYATPFFEANALAAAGYTGIPVAWRRSDLIVLRKTGNFGRAFAIETSRSQRWQEVVIGRMRVFISQGTAVNGFSPPILRSIVPGQVLPCVSRRDPSRRRAQVWTSGNRIFASERPDLVVAAANRSANISTGNLERHSTFSRAERDAVERLSYDLLSLAETEEAEERLGRAEEAPCLSEVGLSSSTGSLIISPSTVSG